MLIERGGGVVTAVKEAEKELNTDELISRRDDISLQDTVTVITVTREAGEEEEEDVIMRVMLLQFIDITVFTSN
ncbi:hypothetical protein BDBG_17151 [Blastomyces gilchristii SLH14081]|uniref:Uncharacterized protein n=1 Tax=Blastomyces gilchristii (strain SLH14081) TaxID=559298 RepID=A0A179UPK3_BLAGS|nr:uncharacterized protein BDBG_17151 [Blastomyces gilchristii SLH14081]OAT09047.1 hypothetical protein BDBG_17151 [Blastomyces gilchristii SLH14081]